MKFVPPKNPHPYPSYDDGEPILGPRYGKPPVLFKPFELANNPRQVRRMNAADCKMFLEHKSIYRKQKYTSAAGNVLELKDVKDQVRQRAADIKRAEDEKYLYRKFVCHIEDIHARIVASSKLIVPDVQKYGWHGELVDIRLQVAGSNSRNIVYDTVNVVTGLWSLAAYEQKMKNPNYTPTPEHFHPRTKSGEDITFEVTKMLLHGEEFTTEQLVRMLFIRCFVTYTTDDENNRLRTYMSENPLATPEEAYAACGIVLVFVSEPSVAWQWEKLYLEHYKIPMPSIELPNFDIISIAEADQMLTLTPKMSIV